jgi:glycerate kinase
MHILFALNSFKGAISSHAAGNLLAREIVQHAGEQNITVAALSDGGDGFLDAYAARFPAQRCAAEITAPFPGERFQTEYLFAAAQGCYVLESAKIFGLVQTPPEKRNPLLLSSIGLGDLLRQIADRANPQHDGLTSIVLGLGGSAINDFGMGAAAVHGLRLIDAEGNELEPLPIHFLKTQHIVLPEKKHNLQIHIIADVEAELTGSRGCTSVFGPQKGASSQDCELIEAGILHLLSLIKEEHGLDFTGQKLGAAGGVSLGLSLIADCLFMNAEEFILGTLGLEDAIGKADLVVTGEGKVDLQTLMKKAPGIIIEESFRQHKNIVLICGELANGVRFPEKIVHVIELRSFFPSLDESIARTREGLQLASDELRNLIPWEEK